MGVRTVPWVQLLVWPIDTSVVSGPRAFAINDSPRHMARPGATSQGVADKRRDEIKNVTNLAYWDLPDPEGGTHTAGYTLAPSLKPLDVQITGADNVTPSDADNLINFRTLKGDYWATVIPDYEPRTAALKWYDASNPGNKFRAKSVESLPAAQSFAFQLHAFGYADESSHLVIQWGDGYGIRLTPNDPPILVRVGRRSSITRLRTIDVAPEQFFAGEPIWIHVNHIAGRCVVRVDQGKSTTQAVYADRRQHVNVNDKTKTMQTLEMRDVKPGPGTIEVWGQGVPFDLRVCEYEYAASGSYDREYKAWRENTDDTPEMAALGHNAYGKHGAGGGDLDDVAAVRITPVDATVGEYEYTADLTRVETGQPSDVMAGHYTPYLHSVGINYTATLLRPDIDPIDIAPALLSMDVDIADPMLAPGTTVTAKIRRDLLPECQIIDKDNWESTKGAVGDAWPDYLNKYHEAVLRVGWYEDDKAAPQDQLRIFDGYVAAVNPDLPGYGENVSEVELQDPVFRLQKPAGVIDNRFQAGDFLLHSKVKAGGQKRLHGHEMVKYILEVVLGEYWADLLRVSPTLTSADHYDLLQYKMLTDPPFGSGFFFPPPWGQGAMDWMQQFAEVDFAIFYFRPHPDGGLNPPEPNYAYYYDVVSGAATPLPDAIINADDVNHLVKSAGWRQRPERDFNTIIVWGRLPQDQGDYRDIMPALPQISSMQYVEPEIGDDSYPEQSPTITWERTLIKEGSHFWLPRIARNVARNVARLLRGVDPRSIPIVVRGEPSYWWGDKFTWPVDSPQTDKTVMVPGDVFRAMRVKHSFDFGEQKSWFTTLSCVPEVEP